MNKKEYLRLLSDTTFKYLFKSKSGRHYFNKIIQIITGINVENYILIDNELNSGNNYKDYITDILLFNEKENIIINIEMNQTKYETLIYRNYIYLSKIIGELFKKGNKINKYKIIQINFNDFYNEINKDIDRLSFMLRDKIYDIELDMVKVIEVYIPTYKDICYNGKNEEEMYLSMFNAKSYEELKSIVKNNKEGLSVMDEIELLAAQEGIIGLYNREKEEKMIRATMEYEGYERGLAEGESIGLEKGEVIGLKKGEVIGLKKGVDKSLEIIKMIKEGKTDKEIIQKTKAKPIIVSNIRKELN